MTGGTEATTVGNDIGDLVCTDAEEIRNPCADCFACWAEWEIQAELEIKDVNNRKNKEKKRVEKKKGKDKKRRKVIK